ISKKEKIMIYGDYDVDGITASALLERVIKEIGGCVVSYIPDRIKEGYGLNEEAVKIAHKQGISVLITVDCGISGREEVRYLSSAGITTIVTDHHKIIKDSFPDKAYAVIDPLQESCCYPFKHLSGVGIAYKFAAALTAGTRYDMTKHLDLVALGTVQDMVPQLGENRILTRYGLIELNDSKKKGIKALIGACGLKNRTISTKQIGYMLGPRINAAGRINSAKPALRLLMTDDEKEAVELADILNKDNRNRQKIGSSIFSEAVDRVENEVNFKDDRVIVLEGSSWHPGVIGIVASKIAERFHRPTVMISFDSNKGKGSARSIENFHLFDALSECRDFLADFGGHAAACGLEIMRENLDKFRARLNMIASKILTVDKLVPNLTIDAEIPLCSLKQELISELDALSPFGPHNPAPVLSSKALRLKGGPRRIRREGIKMLLTDNNITCEAIGFGINDMFDDILESATVDIAYTPSINRWRGVDTLQLELMDVKANLI
ncbi:MAG: single-stranded-DNA-specific exonuclease RecJ, partial [Candidatus Omnitrophota bacterium]|nr:single-stranded-DNA-specific exonuclease RecJ [Candidatus Omnitrophota bacterium]